MAGRPRKAKKTIDEQIEELNYDIEKYEEALQTKRNQKEELEKLKKEEELTELYEIIKENKMTVNDVRNLLRHEHEEEEQVIL